jgi:phosphotransferase system enzyme I (PtsI)
MKGIGVSPGISIGKACIIKNKQAILTGILLKDADEISAGIKHFDDAVIVAINEIELTRQNKNLPLNEEDISILETQVEFLSDPQLRDDIIEKITAAKLNVNDAVITTIADMVQIFSAMEDEYLRARAADIKDIGARILNHLDSSRPGFAQQFEPGTIIIAEDILPSAMITMDIANVTGFVTRAGSKTSHTAIIARSKGIPAVVSCGNNLDMINNNDVVVLDGTAGLVFVNPKQPVINEYKAKKDAYLTQANLLKQLKTVPAATADGTAITLLANISGAADMEAVFGNGGEGVGLFRTELLFMDRDSFPFGDEQFEYYKKVALLSKGKPVIVRTIDIGGDKQLPYFGLPAEQNPFLGYRAIRICLDRTDLFITQIKAILRASMFGNLKIMFPMISNISEVRAAKTIFARAQDELLHDNIPFDPNMQVGIMIEVPSAAITADILAKEVDFFSIGTNDLCQYTLAADRMNEKITHLYDPYNPAVLRLIKYVIEQAHQHHIHVSLCGEMAGDPTATLLLMGMGLTTFSMSANAIPAIKNIIINNDVSAARGICAKAMAMDNSQTIIEFLKGITAQ